MDVAGKVASFNNLISKNKAAQLTALALLSGLIYFFIFTLPFPLTRFFNRVPPLDYTKLTNYSQTGFIAYILGIGLLFWLYVWAIRLTTPTDSDAKPERANEAQPSSLSGRFSRWFLLLSSAFLALISVFAYPLTAIDLFIYAIRTRGWALYGLNPLATAPEMLPATDRWLGLAAEWVDAPSPYGPLWELLSISAFYLTGGDFLPHLLGLKALMAVAYVGCIWLIYKILERLRPKWALTGALGLAWNPLVLLESVQNGHNDIIMIFFLLAALWCFVHGVGGEQSPPKLWVALTILFLILSILVKFVTVITVPFFLVGLATTQNNRLRRFTLIGMMGLVIVAAVIIFMLPLWPGWETWGVLKASSQAGRSLLTVLILSLKDSLGTNPAFDLSRNFILLVFGVIYLYYLWSSVKAAFSGRQTAAPAQTSQILIHPAFFTLFWYVLLAAPVFHAWYLLWFMPLAILQLPQQRAPRAAIVFSITALLVIPYFETVRVWYPYLLQNQLLGHFIGVPILIVPPALAALWPISPTFHSEVS